MLSRDEKVPLTAVGIVPGERERNVLSRVGWALLAGCKEEMEREVLPSCKQGGEVKREGEHG